MIRQLALLLFFALFAVSCSKEDAVEPCNTSTHEDAAKGRLSGSGPQPGTSVVDAQQGNTSSDGTEPEGEDDDGSGISDDGDDISDSEKSRKKRR